MRILLPLGQPAWTIGECKTGIDVEVIHVLGSSDEPDMGEIIILSCKT